MTTRRINGNTYSEFAVVAGDALPVNSLSGLEIPPHDRVEANEDNTVFTFKAGGASGTVVCTLTITYHGNGNLATVTKS
jgi:hypothetical protein